MRDCPTRQASREAEQIQQMFNMDEDQIILQSPLMDTDQGKQTITPVETRDKKGKDDPNAFLPLGLK